MRNNAIFWAIILIGVGVLLLLGNLGIAVVSGGAIWGLVLLALGAWLVWGALAAPRGRLEAQAASIPMADATDAVIRISHGAGRLTLAGGAPSGQLVAGSFGGGLDTKTDRVGHTLSVKMQVPSHDWFLHMPWSWVGGFDWDVRLNGEIPLKLKVEAGASQTELDLTDLLVAELRLETGASATKVLLPAHAGLTTARIEAGVASVELRVPGGVAARIRAKGGLAAINIDETRFPRHGGDYQSPNFATAPHKIEIKVETGLGSVSVR